MDPQHFSLFGNTITPSQDKKALEWKNMFVKQFGFDPNEPYDLSIVDNAELGDVLGIRNIVRDGGGEPVTADAGVIISTIRMGFGHYRIAMAGASAARAMGHTPLWLDLLGIPGTPSDVINWWNTNYSKYSRLSQRSSLFNKYVWESVTSGDKTLPGLNFALNNSAIGWPWRFLKANARDYRKSELFGPLHQALPSDMPILTAHMWNCMGAVSGGMTNVVDMMFDNWPMAFQLTEGAKHAVQGQAGYYGFRIMNQFDEDDKILNPTPADAIRYVGHHVDHELVENIEVDCAARLSRMANGEPRRFLLTMGGAGAQRDLFKAIVEHCQPMIDRGELTLFVNLGDHADNWDWLQSELGAKASAVQTHFSWDETKSFADEIRDGEASGLHVFLYDNTFHGVYASNYLMRVVDVMITKPSELAFYPIPKIFNERVGAHEAWGAIRSAELGDGTIETRTIPRTLQAIDLMATETDLMEMYCDSIVKNKRIGIYDGAYQCVAWATGQEFVRHDDGTTNLPTQD